MTTVNTTAIAHCVLLEIRELMESRTWESIREFKIHDDDKYELAHGIPHFLSEVHSTLGRSTVALAAPFSVVECKTDEEKLFFLRVLRDRLKEGKEIDWSKVEEVVKSLPEYGMDDVRYTYTGDDQAEFPYEGSHAYWIAEQWKEKEFEIDMVKMTIGFCPEYSTNIQYLHKPKDANWLLIKTESFEGEQETNLDSPLEILDELERILVRQTFLASGNKSFADDTNNVYGSFPYAVFVGHWCIPSPENLELLQDWSKDEYYQQLGREKYSASKTDSSAFWGKVAFKKAAIAWMKAVAIELRKRDEYYYSDWKKEWRKAVKVIRAI